MKIIFKILHPKFTPNQYKKKEIPKHLMVFYSLKPKHSNKIHLFLYV